MAAPAMMFDAPRRRARDVMDDLRRFEQLRGMRSTWDSHWREVAERIYPGADEFQWNRRGAHGGGEKRQEKVFDSTPALALDKYSAIITSLFTPKNQRYFRLRASDEKLNEDAGVKQWMETATKYILSLRGSPNANYYEQVQQLYKSQGAFGNGCQFTDERKGGGVTYRNIHIGQMWIALNHEGKPDTFYRCFPYSAKAAFQKWGKRAGERVLRALEKNPWEELEFLHIVAPRLDVDPQSLGPEAMLWESRFIAMEDKVVTEEGGYHEAPYHYARLSVSPGESYGRGPGMTMLPDFKVLHKIRQTDLRARNLAVDPMLLMTDDGVYGQGSKNPQMVPGGFFMGGLNMQGQKLVQALDTGARPELARELIQDLRESINDGFHVTLFRILVDEPTRTATEVLERAQEKGQLLGPSGNNLQSELYGPTVHRELGIAMRQGALPPLPPALVEARGEYEIEYVAPANRMQRSEELIGIQRTVEILAPFAELDPSALDVFDPEEIGRLSAEIQGVPQKVMRTPEQVAALAEQREQAAQQAQQAALAEQMAGAAKDGAGAVSEMQGATGA